MCNTRAKFFFMLKYCRSRDFLRLLRSTRGQRFGREIHPCVLFHQLAHFFAVFSFRGLLLRLFIHYDKMNVIFLDYTAQFLQRREGPDRRVS